jgi:hypothetical protein
MEAPAMKNAISKLMVVGTLMMGTAVLAADAPTPPAKPAATMKAPAKPSPTAKETKAPAPAAQHPMKGTQHHKGQGSSSPSA